MTGTFATLPALKRLVIESERVISSMVGTNPALFPKVRFWKILYGRFVSVSQEMSLGSDSTYPLGAVNLVMFAYAFTNAGTDAPWKHSI